MSEIERLITQMTQIVRIWNRHQLRSGGIVVAPALPSKLFMCRDPATLRMGEIVFSGSPTEVQQGETMKKIFLM